MQPLLVILVLRSTNNVKVVLLTAFQICGILLCLHQPPRCVDFIAVGLARRCGCGHLRICSGWAVCKWQKGGEEEVSWC
jgi:hypothetical protein